MKLPSSLTLPSGARVRLAAARPPEAPRARKKGEPLFSEVLSLFDDGTVKLDRDVRELPLADFHVLRAVLTKAGFVHEDEIEIPCGNCGKTFAVRPCSALEIGPWVDGELDDPVLDATAPFDEELEILPVPIGKVRVAKTLVLAARSVAKAQPLFEALARDVLDVTPAVVDAMGIVALGDVRDRARIARVLSECDDDAFAAVTDAFLDAYYPMRLGGVAFCPSCKARNDVDAPYEREFAPASFQGRREEASFGSLPDFDTFAALAEEIAAPMLAKVPGEPVELVVDGGTPAVDDGGEPLLGSYVPPHPGDHTSPTRPPTVTIYYRTFKAVEDDDGPYDWEDELRETIEHELEHHVYFLRGHDPMDEEEHAEIDREALRIVGRRETVRRAAATFTDSLRDFARRTWPLWIVAIVALALTLLAR